MKIPSPALLLFIILSAGACHIKKETAKVPAEQTNGIPCDTVLSGRIVLNGRYQGRNLYIQNPFAGCGAGFCVRKVLVNGKEVNDELNSSAFEIGLNKMGFKPGDSLNIEILHVGDCKPKVLNPYHEGRRSTFEIISIEVNKDTCLVWKTKLEESKMLFSIEQFRWNKWVKIGEVEGKGGPQLHIEAKERSEINEYSFKVLPHSGENQFRVKQVDYTGQPHTSRPIRYISKTPELRILDTKAGKEVSFSGASLYEVYDQNGNMVKRGYGKTIDCNDLPRGVYYLNYDNKTTEFIKR